MLAACFHGDRDIRVDDVPEPTIERPDDALVRVTLSCICGSDLHYYRHGEALGFPAGMRTGHEFLGMVEAVGRDVEGLNEGDRVVGFPLPVCGTCEHCAAGIWPCEAGPGAFGFSPAFWPFGGEVQGCQSEVLRVPLATGTLTRMPDAVAGPEHEAALLACVDNMATGWHGATAAGVEPGDSVVVLGDGGVGLCAVHAAAVKGAEPVVCLGHHADRLAVAEEMGAHVVISSLEPDDIKEQVMALTGGAGADAIVQTISGAEPMSVSQACVRRCGTISCVGLEQVVGTEVLVDWLDQFLRNVTITGGIVPGPRYADELVTMVAEGALDPAPIFTHRLPLEETTEAYRLMEEREPGVIKVALAPAS